jgi:hypothetical protein
LDEIIKNATFVEVLRLFSYEGVMRCLNRRKVKFPLAEVYSLLETMPNKAHRKETVTFISKNCNNMCFLLAGGETSGELKKNTFFQHNYFINWTCRVP